MHDSTDMSAPVLRFMHLSNYGMPHLGYLEQMLEKGGGFAVGIFSRGWYLVRIVASKHPYIFLSHTVCNREIIFVRDCTWDCAPSMGACSIRTYQFPSHLPLSPRYY